MKKLFEIHQFTSKANFKSFPLITADGEKITIRLESCAGKRVIFLSLTDRNAWEISNVNSIQHNI